MDDLNTTITDIFVVSILLVVVVYFVGFATDVSTVSTAAKGLIYAATGRNSAGQFQNYPQGATAPATSG